MEVVSWRRCSESAGSSGGRRTPRPSGKWYQEHLGIPGEPESYDAVPWSQEAGTTIFVPFKHDTTYFAADKQWMINFRVRDLKAMVAQLQAAGIAVEVDPEHYPNGWFASLKDPEGNSHPALAGRAVHSARPGPAR